MISLPKGPLTSAVSQISSANLKRIAPITLIKNKDRPLMYVKQEKIRPTTRLLSSNLSAITGITGHSQIRFAHTDLSEPNFDAYRRDSTKDKVKTRDTSDARRTFSYVLLGGSATVGAWGGKVLIGEALTYIDIDKAAVAAGKIEVNSKSIPEGSTILTKWRGMPLFIRHRTQEEITEEGGVDLLSLRDPQHDLDRMEKPEFVLLIGICTHLGCVPVSEQGKFAPGGYYCPCHGSHYDSSGRIRKGPAPLNLEVPPHHFKGSNIIIG